MRIQKTILDFNKEVPDPHQFSTCYNHYMKLEGENRVRNQVDCGVFGGEIESIWHERKEDWKEILIREYKIDPKIVIVL